MIKPNNRRIIKTKKRKSKNRKYNIVILICYKKIAGPRFELGLSGL